MSSLPISPSGLYPKPGTIISARGFATPKSLPVVPFSEAKSRDFLSPGVIVKLKPGTVLSYPQNSLFEIKAELLQEIEDKVQMLQEAAEVRLVQVLMLPYINILEVHRSLYFSNLSMSAYYQIWREKTSSTALKLIKNKCYFHLTPKLITLHRAKELHFKAKNEHLTCIRVIGQMQRQDQIVAETMKKIEESRSALKELAKGKRPFVAGGAIHLKQSKSLPRGKGKNPKQQISKPVSNESELTLKLKAELYTKSLSLVTFKAWNAFANLSRSLEKDVDFLRSRHALVLGQYSFSIWSRYTELRKEARVALKVIRGEIHLMKKQRLLERWRDALSFSSRRNVLKQKIQGIVVLRTKGRRLLSWALYTLERRRKAMGQALSASFCSRVATLKVAQRWRSVVILSSTLKLRLKSLASGEYLAPSSEDISEATQREIVLGIHWQAESLATQRSEWRSVILSIKSVEKRLTELFSNMTHVQRLKSLSKMSHLGEHRSLRELNAASINLIVAGSDQEKGSEFASFSVLKYVPAPITTEPLSISDPLKRSVHLKYAKQQRDFPRQMSGKPPRSVISSPKSTRSETRIRQVPTIVKVVPLLDRVQHDSESLLKRLHELQKVPYSFYIYTANAALQHQRLPLKHLLIKRRKNIIKTRIFYTWKQVAVIRKIAVVVTIRYAAIVGRRCLRNFRHILDDGVDTSKESALVKLFRKKIWFRTWVSTNPNTFDRVRLHILKRGFNFWLSYLLRKAEKYESVLKASQHFCKRLLLKGLSGLSHSSRTIRKARDFLKTLLYNRYFHAWRLMTKGGIRAI